MAAVSPQNSWTTRWGMLLLLSLIMFTGYVFFDLLSPMKEVLNFEYGWDDGVFLLYSSSEYFLLVFFLFLPLGGFLLDIKGIRPVALLSGILMVSGALTEFLAFTDVFVNSGLSTWVDRVAITSDIGLMPASAKLASLGFMVFGVGVETAGLLVIRSIIRWFEGKELALAMCVEMLIARVGVFCAMRLPTLSNRIFPDSVPGHVFLGVLIVLVSFVLLMIYRSYDSRQELTDSFILRTEPFSMASLRKMLGSRMFWLFICFCIAYYAVLYGGQSFLSKTLVRDLGFDEQWVARAMAVEIFIPFLISPVLGVVFDNWGRALTIMLVGTALMLICFLLIAFVLPRNPSVPVVVLAIVLLGISLATIPVALWPSVSKVVDRSVLGIAFGTMYWLQYLGLICFPRAVWYLYFQHGFQTTSLSYVAIGMAALLLGVMIMLENRNRRYELELPNIR